MSGFSHFVLSFLAAIVLALPSPERVVLFMATPPKPAVRTATILFGGDMMFDRSIRIASQKKGSDFLFECIDPYLWSADEVVANLEGPITDNASINATSTPGDKGNLTFTFPMTTASLLVAHNIHIVNIGNNHIENFKLAGVRSTMDALKSAGVRYFGDPMYHGSAEADIHGVHFQFINYNEFDGGSTGTTTVDQIHDAQAKGRIPIVYTHWGIEYATTSPERIKVLAHRFVDAGAEMVIGSHPHVVEEHELYEGKNIYYSLGNFIFDQYFSQDVTRGLLLSVVFTAEGVGSVTEIPIFLNKDSRVCAEQTILSL